MSDDDDYEFEYDSGGGSDFDFEDEEDGGHTEGTAEKPIECLRPDGIAERAAMRRVELEEVTSLATDEAEIVMRHFKWQLADATEAWYADQDRVCRDVGITIGTPAVSAGTCPACFDEFDAGDLFALPCSHGFCTECWQGYLNSQVPDGAPCLLATCPAYKCTEAVRRGVFRKFCSPEKLETYETFRARDFVENNKLARWCPFPDCGNAVVIRSTGVRDVDCVCGWKFCFLCGQEAHRIVSCDIVRRWAEKNADEAENMNWILANTKPCPKCQYPIEKNQGCMHMVCRCKHQFCWLCLADDYNYSHTRDGRPCNKFLEEPDGDTQAVRANLARYAHYFERFKSHERAQEIGREKTAKKLQSQMEDLHQIIGEWMDVAFLADATQQVIDCRRCLKWSYAYGYFQEFDKARKDYFEYQQGSLEQKVDQLQELAEKTDLTSFEDDPGHERFYAFKSQLVDLTKVVHDFFLNLSKLFEEWQEEWDMKTKSEKKQLTTKEPEEGTSATQPDKPVVEVHTRRQPR